MQLAKNSIYNVICAAINATTDVITLGNWVDERWIPENMYAQTGTTIAKAFIGKLSSFSAPEIPPELMEQKIYYLRKTGNNVQNQTLVKVYLTYEDAQSEINAIDFQTSATGGLFSVYFSDYAYRYLIAWAAAAPTLEEIPCCPHVPDVYTDCPNVGTLTYMSETRDLKRINIQYYSGEQFPTNGSLNSYQAIEKTFTDNSGGVWNCKIWFNFYFDKFIENIVQRYLVVYISGKYQSNPNYTINAEIYYSSGNSFSKNMTLTKATPLGNNYTNQNLTELTAQGFIPDTIDMSFSGTIAPPSQIKIYMPEAYFRNSYVDPSTSNLVLKHINLGLLEETLVYDPETLTYWGPLRTYAGIPGRMHYNIYYFYPSISSGIQYVDSDILYQNTSGFLSGVFPITMLNPHAFQMGHADFFTFYPTLRLEHFNSPGGITSYLKLFSAHDQFEGYPTGLPMGDVWFDSRIYQNYNDPNYQFAINANYRLHLSIAFSRWQSAKTPWFDTRDPDYWDQSKALDHYKQNMFYITSVHPNAYITSLGI